MGTKVKKWNPISSWPWVSLLTFLVHVFSLYIEYEGFKSLNEENSRMFHTRDIKYDVCLVIFNLLSKNVGPKTSGNDKTYVNVGHFANSFIIMAKYFIFNAENWTPGQFLTGSICYRYNEYACGYCMIKSMTSDWYYEAPKNWDFFKNW